MVILRVTGWILLGCAPAVAYAISHRRKRRQLEASLQGITEMLTEYFGTLRPNELLPENAVAQGEILLDILEQVNCREASSLRRIAKDAIANEQWPAKIHYNNSDFSLVSRAIGQTCRWMEKNGIPRLRYPAKAAA